MPFKPDPISHWTQQPRKNGPGENAKPFHIEIAAYEAGLKAVDRVLKIQERRARLLGLESPVKVEHSGHLTLDELKQRLKEGKA